MSAGSLGASAPGREDRHPDSRLVPATYVVLQREGGTGTEVLLQLRRGTPYMDGWWACGAAGHVEPGESFLQAGAREASEEMGIALTESALSYLATVHRTCALPDPVEQRVDVFVTATTWTGEPHVAESQRAAELRWWPLDELPDAVVPHERLALDALREGRRGSLLLHGFEQSLTLVAAVGRNGVIGDGSSMPWHIPADLTFFKQTTMGGVLLMGRGTWDSIGRALPGRRTIVLTRQRDWTAPGAEVAHSLAEALLMAGDREVFVVGGGEIYAQTIEHASRLILTEVDLAPAGSTLFPPIDPVIWGEVSRVQGGARDGTGSRVEGDHRTGDDPAFAWVTWERT